MLQVDIQVSGNTSVVRCAGRILRGQEAARLRDAVLSQTTERIVIVLSQVKDIDAGGLGALIELQGWAKATRRELKLLNPVRNVREVLQATRLTSVLDVCRGDAVAYNAA